MGGTSAACAVSGMLGAVSGGGLATFAGLLGDSGCSRASCRKSPSSVNKRRSVTVKAGSCLFSAIAISLIFSLIILVESFRARDLNNFRVQLITKFSRLLQPRLLLLTGSGMSQRKPGHGCFSPANRDFLPRKSHLAPDVSQRNCVLAGRRAESSDAGDFSYFFFARNNFRVWLNFSNSFEQESAKFSMHIATRSNALHNFLSYVASLVEVERPRLLGLLRQVALADVYAIERNASGDALHFQRLAAHRSCTRSNQSLPGVVDILRSQPDFVRFVL